MSSMTAEPQFVDTNVLVYAHRADSAFLAAASAAVRRLAEGRTPWRFMLAMRMISLMERP